MESKSVQLATTLELIDSAIERLPAVTLVGLDEREKQVLSQFICSDMVPTYSEVAGRLYLTKRQVGLTVNTLVKRGYLINMNQVAGRPGLSNAIVPDVANESVRLMQLGHHLRMAKKIEEERLSGWKS